MKNSSINICAVLWLFEDQGIGRSDDNGESYVEARFSTPDKKTGLT